MLYSKPNYQFGPQLFFELVQSLVLVECGVEEVEEE